MKRKPPKNQRPYASPSGKKARLVQISDVNELEVLLNSQNNIDTPNLVAAQGPFGGFWADSEQLRKWRGSRVTSEVKE